MHKQWQDLLPYYVAGTLPRSRAAELERHLVACDACRRALHEWQMVAGVVQNQAEEWSIQAPPLAPELRFHNLRPSSNGFGHTRALAEMQDKTIRVMPEPRRVPSQTPRLPLTMVAAVLVVVLAGIALVFLSRGDDNESASPGERPTNQVLLRTSTATSTRTRTPLGTPLPMSGSPSPALSTSTPFRLDPTTQGLAATPVAVYGSEIGMGTYRLITLTEVGEIPANTRVRITHAWYTGTGWMYGISTENDALYAEAREWQISYAPDSGPGPTPTAQYGSSIGVGGYPFLTTVSVGSVPANTRVRISSAYYGANGWLYQIVAQDEVSTGEAYDWQLSYAPDQGGPTPYPLFQDGLGVSGYPMRTVVDIDGIPAESRVRISSAWYTTDGWVYEIVAQDEHTIAQAREYELGYAPDYWEGPTPTAQYNVGIGTGFDYVTYEQVNRIPANTRVRIVYAYLTPKGWIYGVMSQAGLSGGEVYEWQLIYSPDPLTLPPTLPPTLTPTLTPQSPPVEIRSLTASPNPAERGASVVITWDVLNASSITLVRFLASTEDAIVLGDGLTPQGEITYSLPSDWSGPVTFELRVWNWNSNLTIQNVLVEIICPVTPLLDECPFTQEAVDAVYQPFERGFMVQWNDTITLHYDDGTYTTVPRVDLAGVSEPTATPPAGLYLPAGDLGRAWNASPGVSDRLGWATGPEASYESLTERHSIYSLFTLPAGRIVQLEERAAATWRYRD